MPLIATPVQCLQTIANKKWAPGIRFPDPNFDYTAWEDARKRLLRAGLVRSHWGSFTLTIKGRRALAAATARNEVE